MSFIIFLVLQYLIFCINNGYFRLKNGDELIQLKITYDKNLEEIEIFLETDKTYKDMELGEFQKEIKLFWERADVWNQAWHNAIYSEAKIIKDFDIFRVVVTRLVMGEE